MALASSFFNSAIILLYFYKPVFFLTGILLQTLQALIMITWIRANVHQREDLGEPRATSRATSQTATVLTQELIRRPLRIQK